ncbi:type II toxin-antitoxin system PemK/MazF family toxin [Thiomicrorhabdus cannonii]|uniref:type II toxin-antitoxin system PemK/MazF family toxin n=1 Tax=Thiomicrorhabdus cannonii TaxID=2748011 RepID=UPI001FEA1FB8|nr:type II toxin-antitoxin system PemK/MazF family toxin [Thiomicrorhabdus cannonii]
MAMSTPLLRGGIYLANLNPSKGSEPGKIRPVLVMQNNWLNEIAHTTVVVLPLSTVLIDEAEPLRFRLTPRGKLLNPSDVLCDQIRALDIRRITSECLTTLNHEELKAVENNLAQIIGLAIKSVI